jgi:hypothetical protein
MHLTHDVSWIPRVLDVALLESRPPHIDERAETVLGRCDDIGVDARSNVRFAEYNVADERSEHCFDFKRLAHVVAIEPVSPRSC